MRLTFHAVRVSSVKPNRCNPSTWRAGRGKIVAIVLIEVGDVVRGLVEGGSSSVMRGAL